MAGKRYSIIIVPSNGDKARQYAISGIALYIIGVIVLTLLGVNAFFTYGFFAKTYQNLTLAGLVSDNEFLTSRVDFFSSEIEKIAHNYEYIVEKEKEIRVIFGLPEIDPQERALGVGGPTFLPEEPIGYPRQLSYEAEYRLDELIRLSSFEVEQYDTIYNALLKKKEQLDHTPSIMPSAGYITRYFGVLPDPFTGIKRMHTGIDISNRVGTSIYATADGTVQEISQMGNLGKTLVIDHGNGISTLYGHINKAMVKVGQRVNRGDKIAEMGNTGRSTGPHLHYSVRIGDRFVNPMEFILNSTWLAQN